MAQPQIITITKVGESGTSISIKVNKDCPVPYDMILDTHKDFKTWIRNSDYILVWTNINDHEVVMTMPCSYVGWMTFSRPVEENGDNFLYWNRFCIDSFCTATIEEDTSTY